MRTLAATLILGFGLSAHASPPDTRCLLASGDAATECVRAYTKAVVRCRASADAACEAGLRASGGPLDGLRAATEAPVRSACTAEAADELTSAVGLDDLVTRTGQACRKWAEDFLASVFAADFAGLSRPVQKCQQLVARDLTRVRDRVVHAYGRCYVAEAGGRRCNRHTRDQRVATLRAQVQRQIVRRCGPRFDALGLVSSSAAGALLDDRVDAVVGGVSDHTRHLAQRVYPPLTLGPTASFGPYPVGVRTLTLSDPARLNVAGTGPRTLTTEIYYPSTVEAIAGVPRDIVSIVGIPLLSGPFYRNVGRAAGVFPLIVYSHGSGGVRFESALKLAHLTSHGFIVVSADHAGDDFFDPVLDPRVLENRPLDVSFLIDQLLAFNQLPGDVLEGAIDPSRIGATGWSYGGYTVLALTTGPFSLGTFTDPRVKAILPLDGSVQVFGAPAIFSTIATPLVLLTGTRSALERPLVRTTFDAIPAGPAVVASGDFRDGEHGTFPDICDIPEVTLELLSGGPVDACGPPTIAWRYARHIINYLALNFFDATLNGNVEALGRLDAAHLARIEDLTWEAK